jgi:hypothetical protein
LAFLIPMLFTAVCMPLFWKRVQSESRWPNVFYGVMVVYFWVSVPFICRRSSTVQRLRVRVSPVVQPGHASLVGAAGLLLRNDQSKPPLCVPQGDCVRVS